MNHNDDIGSVNSDDPHDDEEYQSSEFGIGTDPNKGSNSKLSELEEERKTLARNENKAVSLLRIIVFLVLSGTATILSIGVLRYIQNDQQLDFETSFIANSEKLLEAFHESIERKLEAIDSLGIAMTSYATASQSKWPNVTLPDYYARAVNTRVLAGAYSLNFFPLITDETRDGWEAYARSIRKRTYDLSFLLDRAQRTQQDERFNVTIEEDEEEDDEDDTNDGSSRKRRMQQRMLHHDHTNRTTEIDLAGQHLWDTISNYAPGMYYEAPKGSGPYLPLWQVSPVSPMKSATFANGLSHPVSATAFQEVLTSGQAVLAEAANLNGENLLHTAKLAQFVLSLSQYRGSIEKYLGEPTSALAYPVFDSLNVKTRSVVGLFMTNVFWRVNFQNVLPPNAKGIICVISNTFNQTFTYRVDGEEPTYLGFGDLHDVQFDNLVRIANVGTHMKLRKSIETRSYTSVDLNSNFSGYTLHVYPSIDTQTEFVNDQPILFTLLVVGVFCFTSFIFVIYDFLVARRQRIVMDRAVASSAIVASLFPSQVRNQIYQESKERHDKVKEEQEQSKTQKYNPDIWKITNPSASESSRVLAAAGGMEQSLPSSSSTTASGGNASSYSKPIANLFENTTILFADMAGFTKWSSQRTPEQVFEMLERVYSAFDAIAERRNVFKVETIGDCYVAVTGLPEPQVDHAVIMTKFAEDIVSKMVNLSRDLVDSLGEDTANLQMRVGLNSGNVTAGVLRGQKSRFQLFGDTMNTASRMESLGLPGKIHISQSTADELRARGKGHWVTPREDKIVAKGKGELQTYWVTIKGRLGSTVSVSVMSDCLESESGEQQS